VKYVRIEIEIPPLVRAIRSVWYDDDPDMTFDDYMESVNRDNPRAVFRKFERGIEAPEKEANDGMAM